MITTPPQSMLRRLGFDTATLWLSLLAAVLLGASWWLRLTSVQFNVLALWIGTIVLVLNLILIYIAGRRVPLASYLLAGAAVIVELFLLILLIMANQGGVL